MLVYLMNDDIIIIGVMEMKKYYALIIDVVKSRRLNDEDRFDVQKKLDDAIIIVNNVFEKKIVKSLGFSAGDSVQGLFDTISTAYEAYLLIKNSVFPHVIRAGIGYGEINRMMLDKFHDDDSNRYDGQAYHLSRSAVDSAKKNKSNIIIKTEKKYDNMINPIIDDEEIMFITLSRMAIYSLINLIDPIIDNRFNLDIEYFRIISPLVTRIVNYYRRKSRVNQSINLKKRDGVIEQEELSENKVFKYLNEYYNEHIFHENKNDSTTISTAIRTLLVNLIGSKEQNINALIRASHMDYLRKRIIAKIDILKHFYEEIE